MTGGNLLPTSIPTQYPIEKSYYFDTRMINILIGKKYGTMLLSTLDEQIFLCKNHYYYYFEEVCFYFSLLMKFNLREIYFISEP